MGHFILFFLVLVYIYMLFTDWELTVSLMVIFFGLYALWGFIGFLLGM